MTKPSGRIRFIAHPIMTVWMPAPLWTPSAETLAHANMTRFANGPTYPQLYQWSIDRLEEFWRAVWDFAGIAGQQGERAVVDLDRMPGARFFPEARLNFAENCLPVDGDNPAIIYRCETGASRTLSWRELRHETAAFAAALRATGIQPGDRVSAYLPNVPEAIVAVLGCSAVGAVWSSCSPDFGVEGVLDRFGQIEPRVFIA